MSFFSLSYIFGWRRFPSPLTYGGSSHQVVRNSNGCGRLYRSAIIGNGSDQSKFDEHSRNVNMKIGKLENWLTSCEMQINLYSKLPIRGAHSEIELWYIDRFAENLKKKKYFSKVHNQTYWRRFHMWLKAFIHRLATKCITISHVISSVFRFWWSTYGSEYQSRKSRVVRRPTSAPGLLHVIPHFVALWRIFATDLLLANFQNFWAILGGSAMPKQDP